MKSILYLALSIQSIFGFQNANAASSPAIDSQLIQHCKDAGGTAKVFQDSCADNCFAAVLVKKKEKTRCLPAMTASCDCGPKMCFKENKCVENPKD